MERTKYLKKTSSTSSKKKNSNLVVFSGPCGKLEVASATSARPPPGPEASAGASTPTSPIVVSHLHSVLGNALGDPPRPRSLHPLLLASRPEAVLRSLPLLVLLPGSLPAD
jgi:hypothetical protein